MKNFFIFFFSLLLLHSCDGPKQQPPSDQAASTESSDLLGPISRSDLQKSPFNEWFDSGYQSYQPDSSALAVNDYSDVEILVFLGTRCSDSQREVPHLFKILDHINFSKEKIKMIAVDEDKANPAEAIKAWNIEYVPTIIFIKDQKEIDRIIEAPASTLEKDMQNILGQ